MKAYLILALSVVTITTACNNQPEKQKSAAAAVAPPMVKADNEVYVTDQAPEEREVHISDVRMAEPVDNADAKHVGERPAADMSKKIIKNGEISFESGNVLETRRQILAAVKKLGGYVESDREDTNGDEGRKEYILNVRIPAQSFDAFLGSASATAVKIDSRNVNIRDVSTEFIDTRTRLQNKKILEARYLDLLKRGSKITNLLAIENKLAEIRSDIESTQGQLNYMSKQVDYSTLNITFYTRQATQVAAGNGFGYQLKQAIADGFKSLESLFFWIISIWPVLFATIIVTLFIRKKFRKRASQSAN